MNARAHKAACWALERFARGGSFEGLTPHGLVGFLDMHAEPWNQVMVRIEGVPLSWIRSCVGCVRDATREGTLVYESHGFWLPIYEDRRTPR